MTGPDLDTLIFAGALLILVLNGVGLVMAAVVMVRLTNATSMCVQAAIMLKGAAEVFAKEVLKFRSKTEKEQCEWKDSTQQRSSL